MSKRFVNLWSFFSKEAQKLRDEEASVFSKEEQETREPREPSVGGCEFLCLVSFGMVSFLLSFWIWDSLISGPGVYCRCLGPCIGHHWS